MDEEIREDDEVIDDGEEAELDDEGHPKKKEKDLIDDETVSLEDEIEEELDDTEDSYDDVDDR